MTGRLSSEQNRFFDEEGYLIVKDIFDPAELEPLRRELEQRVDRKASELHRDGKLTNLWADESFDHRLSKIYHDSKDCGEAIVRDLEGVAGGGHTGAEMFKVISHPKLLAVVEDLVRSPEIVASSVFRVRPKIPQIGRGIVPWHQDSGYFAPQCDNQMILTVWVPLVDATVHNGCMQILPRVHRKGVATHHTGGNAGFLVIEDRDLPESPTKAVIAECPRGGAVFMTNCTPHCSTPNHSDVIRWSIDLRYQGAEVPNNIDLWPDVEQEPTPEVLMACYPPEADFLVQSRKRPDQVADYDAFVHRRDHYDSLKKKAYPTRGWTPVEAPAAV
jgi:phytanoyl-CoA hydroxylase